MSWDAIIFNSKQKITSIEEIDEEQFLPIDFSSVLESHFNTIIVDNDKKEIKGKDFSIIYYGQSEPVSNTILNLYGEVAMFELIKIAKINNWQIFDTGSGEMIDLDYPENNGYENFQTYLKQIHE
jgi:hypothetical protein